MTAKVTIQETTVVTSAAGMAVDLYISDAPRTAEAAGGTTVVLRLRISLTAGQPGKLLEAVQRQAIAEADKHLRVIFRELEAQMNARGLPVDEPW